MGNARGRAHGNWDDGLQNIFVRWLGMRRVSNRGKRRERGRRNRLKRTHEFKNRTAIQAESSGQTNTGTSSNRFHSFSADRVTIKAGSNGLARAVICFAGILEMLMLKKVTIIAGSICFATIRAGSYGLVRVMTCFAGILRPFVALMVTIVAGSDGLERVVICFAGMRTSDD